MTDGFLLSCPECGLYESYVTASSTICHAYEHNVECSQIVDIRRVEFYD